MNHVNRMTGGRKRGQRKRDARFFPLPILSISDPSRFFPPDLSLFSDPTPALAAAPTGSLRPWSAMGSAQRLRRTAAQSFASPSPLPALASLELNGRTELRPRGTPGCRTGTPDCTRRGSPGGSRRGCCSSHRPGSPGPRPKADPVDPTRVAMHHNTTRHTNRRTIRQTFPSMSQKPQPFGFFWPTG